MTFDNQVIYVIATSPSWIKIAGDRIYFSKVDAQCALRELPPDIRHCFSVYEVYVKEAGCEEVRE